MTNIRCKDDWVRLKARLHYKKDNLASFNIDIMQKLDSTMGLIDFKVDELEKLEYDMYYSKANEFFRTLEYINSKVDEAEQLLTFLILADG